MAARRKPTKPISKKRKFIKDGVFYAELNDFLARELAEDGYAGCEVRVTPTRTEVIIRATRPRQVVGENGRRVREITALVQKRFKYNKGQIILFAEKIRNKGLSALAQAQAVKFRLLQGLSVRRAAYSVVKFIMDKGAKGCEVVVTGKLRGQRAKAMKFRDGYMIHAGDATNYYVEKAVKHVHLRQGVIGIKVKIMLPHDPTGENGVAQCLPDDIKVKDEPKDRYADDMVLGTYLSGQPQIDVRNLDDNNNNNNMGGGGGGGAGAGLGGGNSDNNNNTNNQPPQMDDDNNNNNSAQQPPQNDGDAVNDDGAVLNNDNADMAPPQAQPAYYGDAPQAQPPAQQYGGGGGGYGGGAPQY